MSRLTDDPNDPELTHGVDEEPTPQAPAYLVLSEAERATKGFVRPVRRSYIHTPCGTVTSMSEALAETYARDPRFYGATYCAYCQEHRPVGPIDRGGEFTWDGTGEAVGT